METKEEVKNVNKQPQELNKDELEQVTGGLADEGLRRLHADPPYLDPDCDI